MSILVDIHKDFGSFNLKVKLESNSGRIGILGPSGSGKSVTLKCIAGIEKPDGGRIIVDGHSLYDSAGGLNIRPQKRNVGYMFQNYALFPTMTVLNNISAGIRGDKSYRKARAAVMLERFNLHGLGNRLPGELSGGQQQRVALARIMAYEPDLIMLDEPFAALDTYLRDRLQHELQEMLSDYCGQVIMVSHNRDEIYSFSDEVFVLLDGKVLASGDAKSLFADPGRLEVARMTGCKNFSSACVTDAHTVVAHDWGVTLKLNREVPDDIKHVGYRAHYFDPVWGERTENCISFKPVGFDDLPFERRYYISPEETCCESGECTVSKAGEAATISWFVQGREQAELSEKGLPDYLRFREEDILLLR